MGYAKRNLLVSASLAVVLIVMGCGQAVLDETTETTATTEAQGPVAPMFEVDPLWPKPLPNHWILGSTIGVTVDDQDHVWIVHRGAMSMNARNETPVVNDPPIAEECCVPAPPVLEFDQAGNLIGHWGGPGEGYEWPQSNHGITFDHKGNLWIGGNGGDDAHVLKFTSDGQFLLQVGNAGGNAGSNDTENFGRVAKVFVDGEENEAYIADGYGNRRVAVLDADTGAFKRYWGAYGNQPDDSITFRYDPNAEPPQQFGSPVHCAELSHDRLLYVCDRSNDRIQVFDPEGNFIREAFIAKQTLGSGSVWDIAFSKDADQTYIYVADGINEKVHVVQRDTLEVLTSFGDGGRQPSQFFGVHSIATDSQGNVYTTETYEGKRVQRFVYKGMGPITAQDQGAVWPSVSQ
ncbi:uncharacterized protein METZ01_LOCUS6639 [marine metagenome]|uniref:SMP-30/Gluconolactonase/LRE-like region domain-containing protein n=1 Tax=marine metagenome TaxID=408172 RepID=A0A381NGV0_9ZZZZ